MILTMRLATMETKTGMLKVLAPGLSDLAMKTIVPATVVMNPLVVIHPQLTLTSLEAIQSLKGSGYLIIHGYTTMS